jgi:hypothetical protein
MAKWRGRVYPCPNENKMQQYGGQPQGLPLPLHRHKKNKKRRFYKHFHGGINETIKVFYVFASVHR